MNSIRGPMMSVKLVISMLTILILISASNAGTALAQGPLETKEGILRAYIEDDPNVKNPVIHYFLQEADGSRVGLDFRGNLNVKPGSKVKVTGVRTSANALAVDQNSGIGSVETTSEPSVSSSDLAIGTKKAAAIFINYSDISSTVPPIPDTLSIFNGDVKNFYIESSYSKFNISADAYGRYNINYAHTCDAFSIASDAIKAADAQVNFNNYQYILVLYPSDLCETKYPYGSIGPWSFETNEGTKDLGVSWHTNYSWNAGVNYFRYGLAHEFGHNLGALHANGWDCGGKIISETCSSNAYADVWDEMGGNTENLVHFGGYHKELYGWLNAGNILTVTTSGKYTIAPIEQSTSAAVILKIPRGNGDYYYVETRSKTGFDAVLPDSAVNGALMKISSTIYEGGDSHLIDATPNSNSDAFLDFQDGGFTLNKVFRDDYRGVKITPLSKNNGVLTVDVTFFAPILKTPINSSTVSTLRPVFDWTDIPARTSYTIQVSKSNTFANFAVNKDVTDSTFTLAFDLTNATTYYWRVKANYSFGSSKWSSVFSFRTQSATPSVLPTNTPTQTRTPTVTATSSTVGPSLTPTNTATWTPTTGATSTGSPSPTPTGTDPIFANGFEDDDCFTTQWSACVDDGGDLGFNGSGFAPPGGQSMNVIIDDNNAIYVTSDHPNAEPRYRARFYFDPNTITMTSGDAHFIFKGFTGTSTEVLRLEFRCASGCSASATSYQLRASLLNDGSAWINTNWFDISNEPHFFELDWRAATTAGVNDGGLTLWIDETQKANLTGVDNDTWRINRVRLGALTGIDTGTRGTYYFDAFESRRQTYIGPIIP